MDRTILHCDCNGFYASVECVHNPKLKEVPMAVCGSPDNRHGIILAKNELAKRQGVLTAETIWQAKQKCPDLTLVPPHREEYLRYSKLVNQIYLEYTDLVESTNRGWTLLVAVAFSATAGRSPTPLESGSAVKPG